MLLLGLDNNGEGGQILTPDGVHFSGSVRQCLDFLVPIRPIITSSLWICHGHYQNDIIRPLIWTRIPVRIH